jgi:hypothetical protein
VATKFLTKGRKRDERGRQLEPVALNAFRALGLPASASQGEIHERAAALRLAHKLGVEKTFDADLPWLGPFARAEADVRDALGRLADPPRRILERLFWFHAVPELEPPSKPAQIREAVDGLLRAGTPWARHDAALLSLAALQRLDPEFRERDAWAHAYALWREVWGRDEFWSLLVATDLRGEFEQLANYGEAGALRERAPRLLTSQVAESARAAVARDDFEAGARALSVLRAASLPAALLSEYENAALGPVEDRAETLCDDAFGMVALFSDGGEEERLRHKYFFDEAWKNFHWRLKPFLARFLLLAGADSYSLRRSCEHAAENLNALGASYNRRGFGPQSVHLYRQARALAPPGSAALAEAEEGLRTLDPSAALPARDEPGYAAALSAELTDMSVPPKLFEGGMPAAPSAGAGDTVGGCLGQVAFYVFAVALCFMLNKCGVINTRRSGTPPPTFNFNFNYNAPRVVIPPMPRLEPLNTSPRTTPTPAKKTRRGRRPAGVQQKAGEDVGTEAVPPPPPTTTNRAPRREAARPAPAGTPKD